MSLKHKLVQTWHRYLKTNFQSYLRSAPIESKQRMYKHVDIQNEFEKYEKERRQQRLLLIEYRQKLKKKMVEKELLLMQQLDSSKIDYIQGNETIQEEFEKSDKLDKSDQINRKNELSKELENINQTLCEIDKQKQELKTIEQDIENLEPDMVLLRGIEKKVVLTMINYYEFQNRHIAGLELNPETIKNIETVHYHVVNNLPIKREMVYEVVPELFTKEIGELDEYKQRLIEERRPKLQVQATSVLQVTEKQQEDLEDDPIKKYLHQEREMMQFVYNKCNQYCDKHGEWIDMKLKSGFQNIDLVLENLLTKNEQELIGQEQEAYKDLLELFKIQDDYHKLLELNNDRIHDEQRKIEMPEFVEKHELLRKVWTEKWEQIIQHSPDFSQSILLPHNDYESQLDKVLKEQRKYDIQNLIDTTQQQLKQKIGGDVPLRLNERKNKDEQLVKQVSILADAMHKVPDQDQQLEDRRKKIKEQYIDDPQLMNKSQERRILVQELPKVLFLNNKDPKLYNIQYWAQHFNIEPQKLRNIFNYITFPIVEQTGENTNEITRILKFIY